MTDLEKSLSVLNDLLHYFREAVNGVPKSDFEKEREFEDEKRLKEFWTHPEDFTYNELAMIESVIENCYGIAQDVQVADIVKMRKYMVFRLDMEANGNPKKVADELGAGVSEI